MIHTYKDLKNYIPKNDGKIPKLIFRTSKYKVEDLPNSVVDIFNNDINNNPQYKLFYFDDDDCELFINDLKDEKILNAYQKLIPTAFKADLFRYCLLNKYGGIYIDFAHRTLVTYDEIIKESNELYVRDFEDFGIYNAFFCTHSNSGILKTAIDLCITKVENNDYGIHPLDVSACLLLAGAYNTFNSLDYYSPIQIDSIVKYNHNKDEFIVDTNNNMLVKCRDLPNYYEQLYVNTYGNTRPITHYDELYQRRFVFKDDLYLEIENEHIKLLNIKPTLFIIYNLYSKAKITKSIDLIFNRYNDINNLYKKHLGINAHPQTLYNNYIQDIPLVEIEKSILNNKLK